MLRLILLKSWLVFVLILNLLLILNMNPINELVLSCKHLQNFYGSSVPTGHERDLIGCALGTIKFCLDLYGKSRENPLLTDVVIDIMPDVKNTLDELLSGF